MNLSTHPSLQGHSQLTIARRDDLVECIREFLLHSREECANIASEDAAYDWDVVIVVVYCRSQGVVYLQRLSHQRYQNKTFARRDKIMHTSATASTKLSSSSPALRNSSINLGPVTRACQRKNSGILNAPPLYYSLGHEDVEQCRMEEHTYPIITLLDQVLTIGEILEGAQVGEQGRAVSYCWKIRELYRRTNVSVSVGCKADNNEKQHTLCLEGFSHL